jgi:hypothetical protein
MLISRVQTFRQTKNILFTVTNQGYIIANNPKVDRFGYLISRLDLTRRSIKKKEGQHCDCHPTFSHRHQTLFCMTFQCYFEISLLVPVPKNLQINFIHTMY